MRKAGIWKDMILAHREPRSRKGRNVRESLPSCGGTDSHSHGAYGVWQHKAGNGATKMAWAWGFSKMSFTWP